METFSVTGGTQTIDFRALLTVGAVQNNIRERYVLQSGGFEFDHLALVEGDAFVAGTTYSFVGGIPLGKSPSPAIYQLIICWLKHFTCCALNSM
jgi:hypothetical protein